jgi:predicted choloylglycine hydrolase
LALSSTFVVPAAPAAEPFRYPEGKHNQGRLTYVQGLPVLVVAGTPEEIGEQTAVLAVKPAGRVLDYPEDILRHVAARVPGLPGELAYRTARQFFVSTGLAMLRHFPPDHRQEMEALVKAGGFDRQRIVLGNTMFDAKNVFLELRRQFGCSTLIVEPQRSATNGPLFGRNLDYPSLGYVQQYSLVTVCRPRGKHAFAAVGFPGLVGCLSGMNDAGLALAILEVYASSDGPAFDPQGTPYALCYRRLLEECATVDEAVQLLRSLKRTTTTNLAVCDKSGGVVLEVTPKRVVVRAPQEGICSCTNHFCTPELKPAQFRSRFRTTQRYETLEKVRALERPITLADVHDSLHAVSQGSHTLQTMIFEPATLRLHVAIGELPASRSQLRVLELAPLLHGDRAPSGPVGSAAAGGK